MSSFDAAQSAEYSRDRFYTQSTDKHGHKSTIRAEVPPGLMAEVGEIVASKVIPEYKTTRDFVRDAVFHRAHDIAEMIKSGELRRELSTAMAIENLSAYRRREEDEITLAQMFDDRLNENRSAFERAYVKMYADSATTDRGRDELARVMRRFF